MESYSVEIIPSTGADVEIALSAGPGFSTSLFPDLYGEAKEMFSIMAFSNNDCYSGDIDVQIRYDASGNVQEVYVDDRIPVVRNADKSEWLKERDGE